MSGYRMDTGGLIQRLNEFVALSSEFPANLCRNHSSAYVHALRRTAGWAVKMWDSSAKSQPGLMTGNLNSLGNFDECVSVRNIWDEDSYFHGQHCLATLKVVNISAADAMGKAFEQVMAEEEKIDVGLGSLLSKGLRWGFCIPSSCTSEDLAAGLSKFIGNTSGVNVSVDNTDCHFEEDKSFSSTDWFAIVILSLLLLSVVLSTVYESLKVYVYTGVDYEIPIPVSSAVTNSLRRSLAKILPRRQPGFLQHSYSSAETRRVGSIEIVPSTSNQPQTSASRHESQFTSMTGHLTAKGKTFWSRGNSVTPTSSEFESRPATPPSEETQSESSRPKSLDLPVAPHPSSNSTTGEISQVGSNETQQPTAADLEKFLALEERLQQVMSLGRRDPPTVPEDITPTSEPVNYDHDPWTIFSVLSNTKKVFEIPSSTANLQSLHGIKFLSICWVLIGHEFLVMESLPAINYVTVKDYTSRWFAMPLLNASLAVNTFMVVTGLLTTFNFLRDMRRRGIYRRNSNLLSETGLKKRFFYGYLPVYYAYRFVRFTPALVILILLQISLIGHLGSGPFWKSGNRRIVEACSESWTGILTYTQNFRNTEEICPSHAWYLMVDMQLYTISPFIFLFLLAWSKKRCLITLGVLVLAGILVSFISNYVLELPAGIMNEDPITWQLKSRYDYMATHTRFAPWVVGIGVGYLLFCCRQRGNLQISMKPLTVFLGWIFSMAAFAYAIFGLYPFQQSSYEYEPAWSSLYSSSCHTMWAVGVGWIILACESNNGGVINAILSWKLFQWLSRLSYCIYLVHLPLITSRILTTRAPIYFGGMNALSSVLSDLLVSIVLATILSLVVEMPFIRLFNYATTRSGTPVRQTVYQNVNATECVPLMGDLEYASYQSSAPRRSITLQQSGSYNAETRSEEVSAETALISEQTESEQHGSSSSTQQGDSTLEESLPFSSLLQGTD